ncbi:CHAT domain-containing protein [Actinomadura opuntiae]|uniref:CHAT domain-containing protein n=1 Tax=Actinomadura sp. OS1-43 TaxID=604315 RepID=UPI00255B2FDD|nr:CHAT domain-containing protein [Actinomadura sp. OS1-43]MDL4815916.1 CHAT domain-containing protein [Actinomadura sp. OS1-43]
MSEEDERALLWLTAIDPATAHARALTLLQAGDDILALRIAGLAAKELGRLDEGLGFLHRALDLATGRETAAAAPEEAEWPLFAAEPWTGDVRPDPYTAAKVRMNLVGLLTARGDLTGALAHAEEAETVLRGPDADRLAANKACALARAGRVAEAHDVAEPALAGLRRGHDPAALNGLLNNIGLARAMHGDFDGAEEALAEAVATGEAAGLRHQTAMAKGNLAFAVSRRGDVPRALRLYAEAEPQLAGERLAQCRLDQAETLIAAGLPREARPLLDAALDASRSHGYRCDVADALLLRAHAELADGDPERAAGTAVEARDAFGAQERAGWIPLAGHVLIKARWAAGERSEALLADAAAAAGRLDGGGWAGAAAEIRIIAARVAIALGRPSGHLLPRVAGADAPAAVRIAGLHATALERRSRGDVRGALAAVRDGLEAAGRHAEALGALDLRARAAGLAGELAALGLGLARSARELLALEERRRAIARPGRLRPPADPERAAALAALRALSVAHTCDAARGGVPSVLAADLAALEAKVSARTRHRSGGPPDPDVPEVPDIAAALGEHALVEMVAVDGELHAVTVAGGQARQHRLGDLGDAVRETGLLRFALRRLAEADDPASLAAVAESAGRLDRLLLAPLRAGVGDRDLVIAPTGPLHGLPWAVLPSLAGRPFTVVPSAAAWLRAREMRPAGGRTVLVAGPGLGHAGREIAVLRGVHPGATVLDGPDARAEPVRDALDGAALAHIAAHGEFREGNALFSRLRLADGPLLVHDLDDLAAPPRIVVLSACDIGRADGGDAVVGMAGVLLALGASTVIASVTPVRDATTPDFMSAFHTGLAAGRPPARALADAPRSIGVAGFLCFGSG